ncbi:cytochrome c and c1 heme-lyase [Cylindrobasidium torrendii FP15055 ss-10]|uniref:Holocytochrome c-type synthase n=1 Tax=Cylindrobasidium torrendii FP15055 ss-10 TaxID=1314674 RepID=A0A0D7BNY1_9AGAR|nr:cytochrome c and c1 heme-lyase [Cylindrobasidium torrendii FP15055 ss-10]
MGQTTSTPTTPAAAQNLAGPAKCPIDHAALAKPPVETDAAKCPIDHSKLNQMPTLSQAPAPNQTIALPVDRTVSSIPRDTAERWEYPSPQQFYNALVRKGWETPEEHIETMVEIHNFLNEEAWDEVVRWERRAGVTGDIHLARFQGKPGQMSPKARLFMVMGWLLPSRFNSEPPFDRHDWVVRRPSTGEEVRYVIDYYSAPDEPDGSPAFSLDVRPALDNFGSIKERVSYATEEVWASFRENPH